MNSRLFAKSKKGGNAQALLLAIVLFYFPSILAIFFHSDEPKGRMIASIGMATFYAFMFCVNYFWLVPKMLVKSEKETLYFASNFLLIVGLSIVIQLMMFFTHHPPHPPRHFTGEDLTFWQFLSEYIGLLVRDSVMMVLSAALAYAMRLSRERESFRQRELELHAEQRQLELQSLKAQLNPHFLFNSINNIYALIGFAPERAQQALHDFSGMLRFMIYDSIAPYVALEKEFRFISDYVELVRLRLSQSVKVECKIPTNADPDLYIAPLLLLTIVENAFKHCSASEAGYFIDINIYTSEDTLVCRIKNSAGDHDGHNNAILKESGIGLDNVKRQLTLLYPNNHTISFSNEKGVFEAEIAIALRVLHRNESL